MPVGKKIRKLFHSLALALALTLTLTVNTYEPLLTTAVHYTVFNMPTILYDVRQQQYMM